MIEIKVKNLGSMKIELFYGECKNTSANFVELARSGYYDGLVFHRVIKGFMIQGGDPLGNGTGGPGYSIKGDFRSNGVDNKIKHERGVLSMARSYFPDSAGSQFFIMHKDATHLDGEYAAFGKVTEGFDVLDKIADAKVNGEDKPNPAIIIEKIIVTDEPELEVAKIKE